MAFESVELHMKPLLASLWPKPALWCAIVLLLVLCRPLAAEDSSFEIADIRINGLQHIQPGTIFGLIPVTAGDLMDTLTARKLIRVLFKSGYFHDIRLSRDGDELVVDITENPSIKTLKITGNKAIPTDNLKEGLSSAGLAEGKVFQPATLADIKSELQRLYIAQGRYNVDVSTRLKPLPLNQIEVNIEITEGNVSRIAHINLVGNKTFSDAELLSQFELKAPGKGNIFSNADRYSREKLQGDLEKLESYYQDRGYVGFRILSTQVSVTPDRKRIYITISLDEGQLFKVSDVQLVGEVGDVPVESLKALLLVKPGTTFSRGLITASEELLAKALSNLGYSFANVSGTPEIDEEAGTVKVKFFVDTGKRTYVRRINFTGNNITRDEVLRREMRQLEGGWASSDRIELSKIRLERLGLFGEVSVETVPVNESDDQIDIDWTVSEQPSGSLSASVGYARRSGALISGSLRDNNVFGTGNSLDLVVTESQTQQAFEMRYFNPYATADGVSRGYSFYLTEEDYRRQNISGYRTESLGAGIDFSFPIREIDRLRFSLLAESTSVDTFIAATEVENRAFFESEGRQHVNYKMIVGWSRSTLNRGLFATAGASQNLGLEFSSPLSDLQFYKLTYTAQRYFPLPRNWTVRFKSRWGFAEAYGDTDLLPFYEHFYAGGFGSVRGFKSYSLGPRATIQNLALGSSSRGNPTGGNLLATGSLELIFPLGKDVRSVRASAFLDAGNVFNTNCPSASEYCLDFGLDEIRYSVGVSLTWLSPLGPLNFSYSFPLNADDDDRTEGFSFEIGGRLY